MMGREEASASAQLGGLPAQEFTRTRADLERFRRGEKEPFEDIWRRYRPALEVLVAGRIRSSLEPALRSRLDSEAEDILQDAAATSFARMRDFEYRGPGSVLAWMSQVATNVIRDRLDHWKAGKRHPGLERSLPPRNGATTAERAPTGFAIRDRGPGPSTAFGFAETRRKVAEVLAALPERQHTIVFWRFFGGAEWAEIAKEVGAPSADAVRMECYGKILPALAAVLAGE